MPHAGHRELNRQRQPLHQLANPDDSGQVRIVGGLPLEGLPPGAYTLRVVVSDGRAMETRTAPVTLAP